MGCDQRRVERSFQSIDNHSAGHRYPDLGTISGFGDEAANEAFCNSANVPNPRFGPHAVEHGEIVVATGRSDG